MLLAGTAMTAISTHASAISTVQVGTLNAYDEITQNGKMAVKNWADIAVNFGWMHTTKWIEFSVDASAAASGNVVINLMDMSTPFTSASTSSSNGNITVMQSNGNTSHPAFSLFSVGAAGFDETLAVASANYNGGVGWNQVDLAADKKGAFLLAGGATGFVGYANSGKGFTNGSGDVVGHGSSGSSWGNEAGHDWAQLSLSLAAGNYLLAIGNSCYDLTSCGNEVTRRVVMDSNLTILTDEANPANRWNEATYQLSITSVPVPGAVWLFGSALAGLVGLRRRKAA